MTGALPGAAGIGAAAADPAGADQAAAAAIRLLAASGLTAGTAESLTGGLVAAALTSVPGASAVFRGGVVSYATDLKARLLDVPDSLLGQVGTVHADVAAAMARGAMALLGVDVAVATTGVAGPDAVDGHPPGTVHVAVGARLPDPEHGRSQDPASLPSGGQVRIRHRQLSLSGNRDQVRRNTVSAALDLLVRVLKEELE